MRAGVFVAVLGVNAIATCKGGVASLVQAARRADNHPQLVLRVEHERRRRRGLLQHRGAAHQRTMTDFGGNVMQYCYAIRSA